MFVTNAAFIITNAAFYHNKVVLHTSRQAMGMGIVQGKVSA